MTISHSPFVFSYKFRNEDYNDLPAYFTTT